MPPKNIVPKKIEVSYLTGKNTLKIQIKNLYKFLKFKTYLGYFFIIKSIIRIFQNNLIPDTKSLRAFSYKKDDRIAIG